MTLPRIVFVFLLLATSARAEGYVEPDWANVLHTLVHFNAFDVSDDALIDEYAVITECPLYEHFYSDDFKWNQVRGAIREAIHNHGATYPSAYSYVTMVQLDRYDFKEKLFRFTDATALRSVNSMVLFKTENVECGKAKIKDIPKTYRAVLDAPLFILGLPLEPDDAEALLQRMKDDKNDKREIYARLNVHITYVEKLHRNFQQSSAGPTYSQGDRTPNSPFQLDARLDSVEFFTDEGLTQRVYTYKP